MKEQKHIVLVEDSSGEAKGICTHLEEILDLDVKITWLDTCDKALRFCKREKTIDLIIVDLHYRPEGFITANTIENGEDLVIQVRKHCDPAPPIIVYSMIDQPVTVDLLVKSIGVDGYIIKGRESLDELASAIIPVLKGGLFISKEARQIIEKNKNALDITRMDRAIFRKLYQGAQIKQLPELLRKDGFTSCGQATIENRIRELKDYFDAKTTLQLVALAKEKKVFMV